MSLYAEGHHYQEFQNLFRRIKVRNDIMPFNDDQLISWELIQDFLKDIQTTTEEQALFDPPENNFKWPFRLKKDQTKPDSVENINPDTDLWLQLDPVDNSSNTPTTGAISNEILHNLADLPEEYNFKFGIVLNSDMKSFPPAYRTKSFGAESSAHLDNGNSNQKTGDILGFVKYNTDGTTDQISQEKWMNSYNAGKFFTINKVKRSDRENFLKRVIWQTVQARLSRSDALLTYENALRTNSQQSKDSACQMMFLAKDWQTLASLTNELAETGTNLCLFSPSKSAFGNLVRSTDRLRRKIPVKFNNWTTRELLDSKINEADLKDVSENEKIEIGSLFKYPLIIFTPLRNHRTLPSQSGPKSCKGLQVTIFRENIAEDDHYVETLIKPERLRNVSNVSNQLANMGNLFVKSGPLSYPKGLHFQFDRYNAYAYGTVFDCKQRAVLTNFLLSNEAVKFGYKLQKVEVPVKDNQGTVVTKFHQITVPISHKRWYNNGKSEKTFSSIEAMSQLSAITAANAMANNNLWAVGMLPITEMGMSLNFKKLKGVALRTSSHKNEGMIRDTNGIKRKGINFAKNTELAKQKIRHIERASGENWKVKSQPKDIGIIQAVLMDGTVKNQTAIVTQKAKLFHERVMQNYDQNRKTCVDKRSREISVRTDTIYRAELNPEIKRLELERQKAFNMLQKWVEKDSSHVPKWMMSNRKFKIELGECSSIDQYEKLLEKYGTNFVVTVSQTIRILTQEKCSQNQIQMVSNTGKTPFNTRKK
jgi:hypothetical protein